MIRHYYHVYADGNWHDIAHEHKTSMRSLELAEEVLWTVGVVGSDPKALGEVADMFPNATFHYAESGFEQHTLDLIFEDLGSGHDDLVLYAHTKGAAFPVSVSDIWRECMTRHLIDGWERVLEEFENGADTVGCHWLTPEEHPKNVTVPYFGGNFWWSTASHLRRLPPPSNETRYHAEAWLGTVRPDRPVDLAPGWPGAGCKNH